MIKVTIVLLASCTICFASHSQQWASNSLLSYASWNALDSFDAIDSLCKMISLEKADAQSALYNLKNFLNTEEDLSFEKLKGGAYNAPILVFISAGHHKISLGVLKHEQDSSLAEKRMHALDEMIKNGFEHFPRILRDKAGEYLVNLGGEFYSCIEYLEPDSNQPLSFEEMFKLTSNFHAYSKNIHLTEAHYKRTLDWFCESSSSITNLDPKLMQWDPSIFKTDAWEECVQCSHYFISPSFREIYDNLPALLIHGDITPNNIIFSGGQPFFIDLETARTDVRLRDFAVFSGGVFLEQYLTLLEEDKLFSCIQANYGDLENEEKEYFPLIVLLERCGVLAWSLQVLKQSLYDQDLQKAQMFRDIVTNTIREINEMCKRISHIKEKMQT